MDMHSTMTITGFLDSRKNRLQCNSQQDQYGQSGHNKLGKVHKTEKGKMDTDII
jgi:hypothetical protein